MFFSPRSTSFWLGRNIRGLFTSCFPPWSTLSTFNSIVPNQLSAIVQFKHFQHHRHHTFVAASALIRIVYQLFILNLLPTILPRIYKVDTSGKANLHCASAGPFFNSQVVEIWDISRSGAIFSRQSVLRRWLTVSHCSTVKNKDMHTLEEIVNGLTVNSPYHHHHHPTPPPAPQKLQGAVWVFRGGPLYLGWWPVWPVWLLVVKHPSCWPSNRIPVAVIDTLIWRGSPGNGTVELTTGDTRTGLAINGLR